MRLLKAWRRQVVYRYGPSCAAGPADCSGRLETHHLQYRSQGGADDWQNGLMFCGHHHRLIHARRILVRRKWLLPEAQKYLAELGWVAWDPEDEGQPSGRGRRGFAPL